MAVYRVNKIAAILSWQTFTCVAKACRSKQSGFSQRCSRSMMAGSSQPMDFPQSARKVWMPFSPRFMNLKNTATLSGTGSRMSSTLFEIYEEPQKFSPEQDKPHKENPCVKKPDVDNPRGDLYSAISRGEFMTIFKSFMSCYSKGIIAACIH